jgi:thiosulfate/3-mercaptopyruvate sulfurtransferase
MRNGLLLELPSPEGLFNTLSSIGVRDDSIVVVVSGTGHPRLVADAARVATTLIYAGVRNVAILDGGHEKWVREGRPVSTDIITLRQSLYRGALNEAIFVFKEYVLSKVSLKDRETVIVDARTPEVYFGIEVEPWAPVLGHIPGAKNLPAPWLLNKDWTFRSMSVLSAIASNIVGGDKEEIIVYCGIGGYASLLWYALHEMLGYANVKIFDGAWQEWVGKELRGPIAIYVWE